MDKKPIKPHPEILPDGINHDHAPQGIPRGASELEAMGVPGGRYETETRGGKEDREERLVASRQSAPKRPITAAETHQAAARSRHRQSPQMLGAPLGRFTR